MLPLSLNTFRQPHLRAVLVWLVLVVYALPALIPAGFMPDLAALQKGLVQITICSRDGRSTILVDEAGHAKEKPASSTKHDKANQHSCPFAWVSHGAAPPLHELIVVADWVFATLLLISQDIIFIQAIKLIAQPRAPPIF